MGEFQKIMEKNNESRKMLTAALAKAALLGLSRGEIKFIEYQLGLSGSFYKGLFDLFWHADRDNMMRLEVSFPEEIEVVKRYSREEDYWDDLKKRLGVNL